MVYYIVDSTFCLSKDYALKNKVKVVSLKTTLDGITRNEGYSEDWQDFFVALKQSKNFPTTSQPNPEDFKKAINEIREEDKDSKIIILTISEGLSGTINSAKLAAKEYEYVTAFDSETASHGAHILLEEVIELKEKGKTYEEILEIIPKIIEKITVSFVPDTMEYLKRGGRVSKLKSVIASIFFIKPIFVFKKGVASISKQVVGLGKAMTEMVANLPKNMKKCCVCYIYDNSNLQKLLDKCTAMLDLKNLEVFGVSPIMGSHIGIGTVGVASLEDY